MRLQDRVAIVTGGSSGIGRAIVSAFRREGARIIVGDIQPVPAGDSAPDVFVNADVSRGQDCLRLVGEAIRQFGRLDVLCNNAGIFEGMSNEDVSDLDEDIWDRVLAVNLKGTFLCSKAALPALRDANGGTIINMASISGLVSTSTGRNPAYSASKAGIIALTRNMAVANARYRVRVNCICPGYIETPMTEHIFSIYGDQLRGQVRARQPMSRFGLAAEIARGAVFLASEESSFMTGAPLIIDGGYTAI